MAEPEQILKRISRGNFQLFINDRSIIVQGLAPSNKSLTLLADSSLKT